MQFNLSSSTIIAIFLLTSGANGFVAPSVQQQQRHHKIHIGGTKVSLLRAESVSSASPPLFGPTSNSNNDENVGGVSVEAEAERLRSMAAQLRAEASALEAKKAQEIAEATERAFRKFDSDHDGEVSVEELKKGLEKVLKTELQQDKVNKLMEVFDSSGDGALQLDEFVAIERFRMQLDAIVRDEKDSAIKARQEARKEAELAQLAEAKMEMINDRAPTSTDKLISILPYLFPLLDGLQFGRFLLQGEESNPIVSLLAVIFVLYRSVPFSGFLSYFALSTFSNNLRLNRLVRFNMQQAIFLDLALFLPGLAAGLYGLVSNGLGVEIPEIVGQVGTDAVFVTLIAAIMYSVGSSVLGATPDKLPFISDQVKRRVPTIDMFDEEGRFIPTLMREEEEDAGGVRGEEEEENDYKN